MTNKIVFGAVLLALISLGGFAYVQKKNGSYDSYVPIPAATSTVATPSSSNSTTTTLTTFTASDVAAHKDATSCYTSISGSVYNLTTWISRHPGGEKAILSLCGKDGTQAFMDQHGGQGRPEKELATFKIGTLAQ